MNRKNAVHAFRKKIGSIRKNDMPSEEIAAIGLFTAKSGREEECYKLAKSLSESTHAEDAGFINYVFLRKADNPREFALYERWENIAALLAHISRLQVVYGPPAPDAPPSSLPAAVIEPFEKMQLFGPFRPLDSGIDRKNETSPSKSSAR